MTPAVRYGGAWCILRLKPVTHISGSTPWARPPMQALVFGVTNPLFPAAFYLTQGGDGGQFLPQAPGTVLGAGAQACLGLRTPARWCCCRPNCSSTTPALGQEHNGCEATKSSSINPGHPMVSTLLGRGSGTGGIPPSTAPMPATMGVQLSG